jgi:hypothetical protein
MRARTFLVATCLTLAMAIAALAVDFNMRPGRWEVTTRLDYGSQQQQLPAGMPLAEPIVAIDCVTAEDVKKLQNPIPLLDKSCEISNYRVASEELSYTLTCDDVTLSYRFEMLSPDSFSGVADSHGEDPSQKLLFKVSGKRTGDACSAKELAEDQEPAEDAED